MPVIVAFSAVLGPVALDVILSEKHTAHLDITQNPVELGADVTDHAIIRPKEVVLEIASSLGALAYIALLRFQESRVPFTLVTGLNVYFDMLIERVEATRHKELAIILNATVTCKQLIIVSTATAAATKGTKSVSSPGKAGGKLSKTAATPSKELANNTATADRVAAPVQRGDSTTTSVPSSSATSLLKQVFG